MPITLTLPPADVRIDAHMASIKAETLARYLAMAAALEMNDDPRSHWLDTAIDYVNEVIKSLDLRVVPVIDAADPIDALFDRANIVALNGQVLR